MSNVKLKVNDSTASEELIKKAQAEVVVIDEKGRAIKLKKPSVLAQFRLIEALGDTAKNQVYTAMVLPLIYIVGIDDEVLHPLNTKREIEALIQRLDEDGISAVSQGVMDNFAAQDPESDKTALKN